MPDNVHGGKPLIVLPGLMLMLARMEPVPLHVTLAPAMIPLRAAVPKSTSGGGGAEPATITVAKPTTWPLIACTVLVYVPATVPAVKTPVPLLMLPAVWFTTDQTGTMPTRFPFTSLPTAVKVCGPPVARLLGFGLTVIDASAPTATFTVAKPEMPPLVACTVFVYVPDTVPAMKSPVLPLMLPAVAFTTDQTGTMPTRFPFASLPTAVKVCVPPVARLLGFGLTVIDASAPTATVTVAKPEMPPLVACTVLVYVPDTVPAVKSPVPPLMLPAVAFPTDQVGVITTTLPLASVPTAANCCVALMTSVVGVGV